MTQSLDVALQVCDEVSSTDARACLRATGLVKSFRSRTVVKGVTIDVYAGEVVGLLGPNGAGKTTIFDMVVGLCQPDEGEITFKGESITSLPMYRRARKGIGYLPQESSVFRRLSVEHNVLAILEMLGYAREERMQRVELLLNELDLAHIRKSMAYALSGGERRRLESGRSDPVARCGRAAGRGTRRRRHPHEYALGQGRPQTDQRS